MKSRNKILVLVVLISVCGLACADRWAKVVPGMTSKQVCSTMKVDGPNKVDPYHEGYAAWFFGEENNRCVLLKDDVVVSKDQAEQTAHISFFGLGGAAEKEKVDCVPPGQTKVKRAEKEQSVATPFGTLKKKTDNK